MEDGGIQILFTFYQNSDERAGGARMIGASPMPELFAGRSN